MGTGEFTAAVIIIGNEILSGRTQDVNLAHLGRELDDCGIRLLEARVVQDLEVDVIEAINACRRKYTYVFTTGGIGPTHDDITTACVAQAFGVEVERNQDAIDRMEAHYPSRGQVTEARLKMADIPRGATLVDNPVSAAPGYQIENVFVFAGIPTIMQAMFESIRHRLEGGAPMLSQAVRAYIPESVIAQGLETIQMRYPGLSIGSYPFSDQGRYGTQLVLRGTDEGQLEQASQEVRAAVTAAGGELG